MNLISSWLRRRAIVQYRNKLPAALSKDYGKSDYYLPAQVSATVERQKLNKKQLPYALAMFSTGDSYALYQSEGFLDITYADARHAVGQVLFEGRTNFKQSNFSDQSVGGGGGPGHSVDGFDGGGDGGSAGGGGDS